MVQGLGGIKRSGEFVTPGDKLGVIEEFIPAFGTYVDEGAVYSKIVGSLLIDFTTRKISVYPLIHRAVIPRVGNVVIGPVVGVQDSLAFIRIIKIGAKFISGFFTGILHISEVSLRYTKSMFDVCRLGDIIRAKVISNKNKTYHLSTKGLNLGVIYAFCSKCGDLLTLSKQKKLKCKECGNIEKRKITSDYGKFIL
ncbi:TPA: RNA-binding protein [Candidatus Bathyarchaeota archaeon]|nr:RNA-binding protein [Candidatus Bathyarchaeota archaeon]